VNTMKLSAGVGLGNPTRPTKTKRLNNIGTYYDPSDFEYTPIEWVSGYALVVKDGRAVLIPLKPKQTIRKEQHEYA